jgi:secreted Zn-dependent insulinase-like peptidase
VIYQIGPQEIERSATLDLLALLMKDECFDQLRTKQQLGYNVYCLPYPANRYILALR